MESKKNQRKGEVISPPAVLPTEAELSILRVLWSKGACTVRGVHDELRPGSRTRYTTTLKQLQVMTEKGLVDRDRSQRSHVYRAAIGEDVTQRSVVSSFVQRIFQGSVHKLVLRALEAERITDDELHEIKLMLERHESGEQP